MLKLSKYSLGVGDRFAQQAKAQLRACMLAAEQGAEVVPVWNKSHREHTTVGSPARQRPHGGRRGGSGAGLEKALPRRCRPHSSGNRGSLPRRERFLHDRRGRFDRPTGRSRPAVKAFAVRHADLIGRLQIPGIERPFEITGSAVEQIAGKYLRAVEEAGGIYRHIAAAKGAGNFITEVSMDETDSPQTPPELLIILAAIADQQIPIQTIAPKFTGRFNKGVDYVGALVQFEKEFQQDLAVIAFAIGKYALPANLKLSVHSGSDKFSLYAPIRRGLARFDAGLHIKTAGTTWLEEVIGLAEAGGAGLDLAKEIYTHALEKRDALCAPYAAVIDIDPARLPAAAEVQKWSSEQYVQALRHDPGCPAFNPHLRQLIHVGYKIAAQMGQRYLQLLEEYEPTIAKNVTGNLYDRHLKPLLVEK